MTGDGPRAVAAALTRWRPSLSLVVFLVLTSVLSLPLLSLYFLKVYQNQLIQQTEAELIAQSAVLAAVLQREIETSLPPATALGQHIKQADPKPLNGPYQPIFPTLELEKASVLPPRPPAQTPAQPANPAFVALGRRMMPDLAATQKVTLAGFRLLDPNGIVIAGRDEIGLSLADLDEVRTALQGRFSAALRVRISKHDQPALYSISRGTGMRIFIAMPVTLPMSKVLRKTPYTSCAPGLPAMPPPGSLRLDCRKSMLMNVLPYL